MLAFIPRVESRVSVKEASLKFAFCETKRSYFMTPIVWQFLTNLSPWIPDNLPVCFSCSFWLYHDCILCDPNESVCPSTFWPLPSLLLLPMEPRVQLEKDLRYSFQLFWLTVWRSFTCVAWIMNLQKHTWRAASLVLEAVAHFCCPGPRTSRIEPSYLNTLYLSCSSVLTLSVCVQQ